MTLQPIHTLQSKHFVLIFTYTLAITLFAAIGIHAQQRREGVSVQMAVTTHAVPMPAADDEDAWVVAVTADGRLYFGTRLLTTDGLAEQMKVTPRRRDQNLYVKADARTPFAGVQKVLEVGRSAYFDAPVLLTSQPQQEVSPGTIVPPMGMAVHLDMPPQPESVVIDVLNSAQSASPFKVNGADVPGEALPRTVKQLLQDRTQRFVAVKAAGSVPFARVVDVINLCHAVGAEVVLSTPSL